MEKEQTVVNDPMLAKVQLTYSARPKETDYPILDNPADVYGYLCDIWDQGKIELQEEFVILLMNNALRVLGWSKISSGSRSATIVDIPMIVQIALLSNASHVIIAHNHPSGRLKPSIADVHLTQRIKKALKLLDITLDDHIILARKGFYSFEAHCKL